MNINDFKRHFFKKRSAINDIIDTEPYNNNEFVDEIFMNLFDKIKPEDLNNDHVVCFILNCIQLINNKDFCSKYTLDDIEDIYKKLIAYKEYTSIDVLSDYAHFLYGTMDKNAEAKRIAIEGVDRAQKIIKELKTLLKKIEEDSL